MSDQLYPRLGASFYRMDVLELAVALLGQQIVLQDRDGQRLSYTICETEAYRGQEDLACHARSGRTHRTEVMYREGGLLYMYLIYGMHWMMNVVAGPADQPQAVLIRGVLRDAGLSESPKLFDGPGKLTKALGLDASFKGEDLCTSQRIWIGEVSGDHSYSSTPRIGIDYAPEPWLSKPWRFIRDI